MIALVQRGRGSFAVIAGKEGDEGGLLWGKIVPWVFADDAGGFLVVRFFVCGGGPTGVMEKRCDEKEFSIGGGELVVGLEFTEKKLRPKSDMLNVSGIAFIFFHEGVSLLDGGGRWDHRRIFFRGTGAIWSSQTP